MRLLAAVVASIALTLAGSTAACADTRPEPSAGEGTFTAQRAATVPTLEVTVVAQDLDVPWDVQPIGDGDVLVTQRDRQRLTLIEAGGDQRDVTLKGEKIWSTFETGLMGLEIDPDFTDNGLIYTCSGWKAAGTKDIRVIRWKLNQARTKATLDKVLLTGLPTVSGRHGGCRLLLTRNGSLLVGTGDAAQSENPQSLRSLGGKTLRLDPATGKPWPSNKWAEARGKKRYIFTFGHRNVQGLAQRSDGSLWSIEHGTYRDDEVNLLRKGRNYGWQPGPGYDESRPMTDQSLPGKQWRARWRSGSPTIATSGASFVPNAGWGRLGGTLAVAALGGQRLLFLKFDDAGHLTWQKVRLRNSDYGRLRSVTVDTDGSLLVTTSNGGGGTGGDQLLRISPK